MNKKQRFSILFFFNLPKSNVHKPINNKKKGLIDKVVLICFILLDLLKIIIILKLSVDHK